MYNPRYYRKLAQVNEMSEKERTELQKVCDKFPFRSNEYYISLINWDDPYDPIRRIIIPTMQELELSGDLDASNEKLYTKIPGLEHKYEHIAVLLINDVCGGYCRFCFRKRLFMDMNDEIERDIGDALEYIRTHRELNNILITGGDPFLFSTAKLEKIIKKLREIEHINIIRIGTKVPAFNPYRILNDPALLEMLENYSTPEKKIYLITHFNQARELTDVAIKAMHLIQKAGVPAANQTPIIRGVNDSPEALAELLDKLSFIGVIPYYVFQCRPTQGNRHLAVPVERSYEIHEQAKMMGTGLSKRSRYVMSHTLGKIEVIGLTGDTIMFRFHRSAEYGRKARIEIFKRNPDAYWYDDYTDKVSEYILENPFYENAVEASTEFTC